MRNRTKQERKIRYDVYHFSPGELAGAILAGALLGLAAVWICYDDWRALPAVIPVILIVVKARREQLKRERQARLLSHFREFISSLYSNLAAGYSIENSVRSASGDMESLYGKKDVLVCELKEICRQLSLRIPVERLMYDLGERSGLEDIHCFGEVLMIVKRSGGNLDKAIRESRRTICERIDTRQEIETIIAAKRYEQNVMSVMPAGIVVYMRVSFGEFMDPLYKNPAGIVIMTAALVLYAAAVWLGRKFTRIDL